MLSTTENYLFTGTKTDFSQYLSNENTHGLIDIPKYESSLTKQTCLVNSVLNQSTCFSCNKLLMGFMDATLVLYMDPFEYI